MKKNKSSKITFSQADPDYHYNDDLIDYFREILEIYEYQNNSRRFAYKKAIGVLKKIDHPLLEEKADKYEYIGESISKDIGDFINGKKTRLERLLEEYPPEKERLEIIRELVNVHGIGPSKANDLYEKGARKIKDLSKNKYYQDLTDAQKLGLKYYKESTKRIPRDTMKEYDKLIRQSLGGIFDTVQLAGSYRRETPDSGDVDVMILSDKITIQRMNKACNKLIQDEIIVKEYLAKGPTKFMGYTTKHHRIDIRFYTPDVYPVALLHLTGSDDFNKKMRQRAIDLGMRLSEYALTYYNGSVCELTLESSVFAALFVKYIEPFDRSIGVKLVFTDYLYGLD